MLSFLMSEALVLLGSGRPEFGELPAIPLLPITVFASRVGSSEMRYSGLQFAWLGLS